MPDPLDMLSELQRLEVEEALKDPAAKERFIVAALVQVRDDVLAVRSEATIARVYCRETCAPKIDNRLDRLEKFKVWLLGIGAGIAGLGALVGLFLGAYELALRMFK